MLFWLTLCLVVNALMDNYTTKTDVTTELKKKEARPTKQMANNGWNAILSTVIVDFDFRA